MKSTVEIASSHFQLSTQRENSLQKRHRKYSTSFLTKPFIFTIQANTVLQDAGT